MSADQKNIDFSQNSCLQTSLSMPATLSLDLFRAHGRSMYTLTCLQAALTSHSYINHNTVSKSVRETPKLPVRTHTHTFDRLQLPGMFVNSLPLPGFTHRGSRERRGADARDVRQLERGSTTEKRCGGYGGTTATPLTEARTY